MKKLLEGRSKVAFIVFILSVILICLLIPAIIIKSQNIYNFFGGIMSESEAEQVKINGHTIYSIFLAQWGSDITILDILLTSIIFVISLFNITGFIWKKIEFNFISIGLSVMTFCFTIYLFENILSMIPFILLILLNIWGYISQLKLNKK